MGDGTWLQNGTRTFASSWNCSAWIRSIMSNVQSAIRGTRGNSVFGACWHHNLLSRRSIPNTLPLNLKAQLTGLHIQHFNVVMRMPRKLSRVPPNLWYPSAYWDVFGPCHSPGCKQLFAQDFGSTHSKQAEVAAEVASQVRV